MLRKTLLRKTMIALCAAVSVVALTPNMALAGHGGGGGGGHGGGGFGGGGGGGFGGHAGGFGGGFGGHSGGFAAHSFSGGGMNSFARAAPSANFSAVQGNRVASGNFGNRFASGNFGHGRFGHGFHHGRHFFVGGAFFGPGFYDDYWDYPDYAYYDYPDYYGYDSNCYIVHRRVHTSYGWRVRPVQVCS